VPADFLKHFPRREHYMLEVGLKKSARHEGERLQLKIGYFGLQRAGRCGARVLPDVVIVSHQVPL
jgi:hypothetical protein